MGARKRVLTDEELVEAYKAGDEKAFDAIYERYYTPLMGFLSRMCRNEEDAKETLQDVFLSVFRYLHAFRGESSLKNWIYKIATRSCLRNRSKRGQTLPFLRSETNQVLEDVQPDDEGSMPSAGIPKWENDPERSTMNRELRHHIIKGVASLPYIYKVVINLRDFEGFSTQEVSEILGIKETTVKVRLHRARLYLREWLKNLSLSP